MEARFEFATAARIVFGAGMVNDAGAIAKEFGRRALVVTGRDARRAERLLAGLKSSGVGAVTFSIAGEPELDTVERGR
jgi:alcohol dehydrogenase class IV